METTPYSCAAARPSHQLALAESESQNLPQIEQVKGVFLKAELLPDWLQLIAMNPRCVGRHC